jgi:hypothetical protein
VCLRVDDLHGIAALADAVSDPAAAAKRLSTGPVLLPDAFLSVLGTLISVVQLPCCVRHLTASNVFMHSLRCSAWPRAQSLHCRQSLQMLCGILLLPTRRSALALCGCCTPPLFRNCLCVAPCVTPVSYDRRQSYLLLLQYQYVTMLLLQYLFYYVYLIIIVFIIIIVVLFTHSLHCTAGSFFTPTTAANHCRCCVEPWCCPQGAEHRPSAAVGG